MFFLFFSGSLFKRLFFSFSLSVYLLMIRTGEKPFVGSISSIEWIVRGTEGVTRRLTIPDHRGSLFQSNQLDTFALVGFDIGEPMEIW